MPKHSTFLSHNFRQKFEPTISNVPPHITYCLNDRFRFFLPLTLKMSLGKYFTIFT